MQCIFSVVFPNKNQEKALRGPLLCKKEELCVLCTIVLFKAKKEAYDVVEGQQICLLLHMDS